MKNNWYETYIPIRQALTKIENDLEYDELKAMSFSDLEELLTSNYNLDLPKNWSDNIQLQKEHRKIEKDTITTRLSFISYEEEVRERIEKLVGKQLNEASRDELVQTVFSMTHMDLMKYRSIVLDDPEEKIAAYPENDLSLIIGVLDTIIGEPLTYNEVKEFHDAKEFGLGVANVLAHRGVIEHYDFKHGILKAEDKDTRAGKYLRTVGREINMARRKLINVQEQYQTLVPQHKINSPQHIPDLDIDLDLMPMAMSFVDDTLLAIVGYEKGEDPINLSPTYGSHPHLALFDVSKREIVKSIQLRSTTQSLMKSSMFAEVGIDSLVISSDGMINIIPGSKYDGYFEVYNKDLELNKKGSKFTQVIDFINKSTEYTGDRFGSHQAINRIVERDGIFYCAVTGMRPIGDGFSASSGSLLIATDGERFIGKPFQFHTHTGFGRSSDSTEFPVFAVDNRNVYMGYGSGIIAVDRGMNDIDQIIMIAEPSKNQFGGGNVTNLCTPQTGIVWAVSRVDGEVDCHTMKVYGHMRTILENQNQEPGLIKEYRNEKGFEMGTFLTHMLPQEPFMAHNRRPLAVNKSGLVAYADFIGQRINFYEMQGSLDNTVQGLAQKMLTE